MSEHNRELACHYVGRLTGLAAIEQALDAAEARGRRAGLEEGAAKCISLWQNAKNEPPDWFQNAIARGCMLCESALKKLAAQSQQITHLSPGKMEDGTPLPPERVLSEHVCDDCGAVATQQHVFIGKYFCEKCSLARRVDP